MVWSIRALIPRILFFAPSRQSAGDLSTICEEASGILLHLAHRIFFDKSATETRNWQAETLVLKEAPF